MKTNVPTLHRYTMQIEVSGIHRHTRTVTGSRNAQGFASVTTIDEGWYIHFDFGGNEVFVGVGNERPPLAVGDVMDLALEVRR